MKQTKTPKKRRDIGKSQLPPIAISAENSLDMNKNLANGYQNKREDESLNNVYPQENSRNDYPKMANNIFEGKNSYKLENSKRNSDILKTVDNTGESLVDSNFDDNENVDLKNNRRSMQSLRNMYITDEAISDGPESITKTNNQNDDIETKIENFNDMISNKMQDDEKSLGENFESATNSVNKNDYVDSSSDKRDDNLILRDTNLEYDQKFIPELVKIDKSPRALNKTISSQAAPKLTFFNANQSSTEFQDMPERNEFTSKETSHLSNKRMINGKFMLGRHHFHKRHKTKHGRDSLPHLKQKFGMEDHNFHESVNHKTARQSAESAKIHESSRRMFNSNADDKILTNQIKGKLKKKSIDTEKAEEKSNQEYVERDLKSDSTKYNQDANLKVKKSVESKTNNNNNLEASKVQVRRNSTQGNASDPYLSKKRSVEIRDATNEKENAIHFEKNIDNQDETPDSSEMKENNAPPKNVRNSSKFQTRNGMNNYNRQTFLAINNLPLTSDSLKHRKSLPPPNPYYPYAESKNSKYDSNGGNQKRVPGFARAGGVEIKQLRGPHNYELNIAKHLNNKKAKVDEKLSRTMEDHKVKKTILKDAKSRKETDIIENENEKVIDNVHVISDPNQISPIPPPAPVEIPFLPARPINPFVDQDKIDEGESSEEQVIEPDNGNLNIPPNQQIDEPAAAEAEVLDQSGQQNAPNEDYYEEESKEKDVSDNYYDINANQENEVPEEITQSLSIENNAIPSEVEPDIGSESSQADQASYVGDYSDDSQKSEEIPPVEDVKPMKVVNKYRPPADITLNLSPEEAPAENIYKLPPPDRVLENFRKNGIYRHKYKLPHGKGKKHKKIYRFSTEYAVSDGMDEFEKEEKLEKASKTVVRNKLMTANESSHHFQEKKTEIKDNKESYHEALIEEKDESKFPRNMDVRKSNLQRSISTTNSETQSNSENDRNSNRYSDSVYARSSANDNDVESVEDHEHEDQPRRGYSGRISERYSPSEELRHQDDFIDDVKRNQPRFKIIRDANTNSFTNESHTQVNLHDGRRDASSLNGVSNQEMRQQNSESNLEGRNKEVRDLNEEATGSGTPKETVPHSESKSGNVVYITMRTTTVDAERKYHDFIQIQDGKRNAGRYERHPKRYSRKRRKNRNTGRKTFGP